VRMRALLPRLDGPRLRASSSRSAASSGAGAVDAAARAPS
jgi:hypothetical protein